LHQGLRQALFRWLDRLPAPDARYILRLDEHRFAYVDVEDTPLVATSLRWMGEQALLGLTDGSEEALDPATLTVDDAGVARARVRGGRLEARLATAAASALGERLDSSDGSLTLLIHGKRMTIPRR